MAAATKSDSEERDGVEGNIKPDKLGAEPSWSFSFVVTVVQATFWWFQYMGLFLRNVHGHSRVSQAAKIPPKPQFWRVTGIENGEKLHAQEWLRRVSPGGHSLAGVSTQRLCATLTTFGRPKPALDGWLVESAFLGITPLSSPADAAVDVVAITGLGGHAMGSFRSTDGSFLWLRDVLPKTLPEARILTYGYDTALLGNKSKESIRDLAKVFLDALTGFRYRTKTQQRPLCFIGHSLGGVILKEALAIADLNHDAESHEVVLSTYGLILLGVPNLGLRHPQLMTMVEGNPNQQFVRDLVVDEDEAPSPYLNELTAKFSRVCSRVTPPFHIVSYYETERSPTVKLHKGSQFELSGEPMMMVTERSAERIGHTIRDDGHLPMSHTNHRGLVRFDHADDPRYISLQEKIQRQVEKAPEVVKRRFNHIQELSTEQQRLWTDFNRPPFSDFRESERLVRPEQGTLLWLLESKKTAETSVGAPGGATEAPPLVESQATEPLTGADFVDWRDSLESRCLLVTAPPGSGKSVLSNFVTGHLEERTAERKSEKVIYYFCNIRVPLAERNAEAVVRSLIVQLCQDQGNLIALLPLRFEKDSKAFFEAPLGELWSILNLMMQKHWFSHVHCIIDGLDVYGECMVELVQKLLSLFGNFESKAPTSRKLLCTSRPNSDIMDAWEGHPERQLRPNLSDVRTYVERRVATLKRSTELMKEAARSALMKDFEVSCQPHRVIPTFLWISTAVRKLEQLQTLTPKNIREEIEKSPRDLDELYKDMIVTVSERAKANAVILAWVIYAEQPLTLEELQEAVAIDPSRVYENYGQLDDTRPQLTELSLRQVLGVLLDVLEGRVFVIHQSVQDFVKRTNFLDSWISPEPRLFVADCCMRYLLLCSAGTRSSRLRYAQAGFEDYPLRRISQDWYRYIETTEEGNERMPMLQAIVSLRAYMNRYLEEADITGVPDELTDVSKFLCVSSLSWMAELVLEGKMGSAGELLQYSVLAYTAKHRESLFEILIPRWQPHDLKEMQGIVKVVASDYQGDRKVTKLLLDNKPGDVNVTSEIILAAAGNKSSGGDVMLLLSETKPDDVHITSEVLMAAAENDYCGEGIIQLLIENRPDEVHVTPKVILAAVGNHDIGRDVMQLLLETKPEDVHVTSEVLMAALKSYHFGEEILQLLREENQRLREKMLADADVTSEVTLALPGNYDSGRDIMQLLLETKADDVYITSEVLIAAAESYHYSEEMI